MICSELIIIDEVFYITGISTIHQGLRNSDNGFEDSDSPHPCLMVLVPELVYKFDEMKITVFLIKGFSISPQGLRDSNINFEDEEGFYLEII